MSGLEVAGEIIGASTALAGLILVYIGALVSSYDTYSPTEKRSVKAHFQKRAWLAFIGFLFALVAAATALIAKAGSADWWADLALYLALGAFAWTVLVTVATVREIN